MREAVGRGEGRGRGAKKKYVYLRAKFSTDSSVHFHSVILP